MLASTYPSAEIMPTVSLLSDSDIDFFKFNTFDYRLMGDDQLMDKTIMEVFAEHLKAKGLKRSTTAPDIYLYLTKDVNQKIESVYVPSYTTTTTTGDTGIGISNFLGIRGVSVGGNTGKATTRTEETGTMRTNVTADAYLELSVLEASKLNSDTPPVIWQLTYSEHKTSEIRLLEYVKEHLGKYMLQYPFHESMFGEYIATWGVLCENFAVNPTISDVVPGSKAEALGCKKDDVIKYVRYNDTDGDFCTYRPGENFYRDRIIKTANMMQIGKQPGIQLYGDGTHTEQGYVVYIFTIEEEQEGIVTKQYYIVGDRRFCLIHLTNFTGSESVDEAARAMADSFVWKE